MSTGKSVRLFLADGTPGGLLTTEIMNWTGHVIAAPRSDLAAVLKRPQTGRAGIYILLGHDPDSFGGQMAYIGEGADVGKRLYQHARSEDRNGKFFSDRAIVLSSKDANLTKADTRYLESQFIQLALIANRTKLTNSTTPPPISLPEAGASEMEYFIEQAKIVLPVLGVNIFRSIVTHTDTSRNETAAAPSQWPTFELTFRKAGITASAKEVDGEFGVWEGSKARRKWIDAKRHCLPRRGPRSIRMAF